MSLLWPLRKNSCPGLWGGKIPGTEAGEQHGYISESLILQGPQCHPRAHLELGLQKEPEPQKDASSAL